MSLTVTFKGGTKFTVGSGKHRVVTDQPIEDGGTDEGMSPVELFIGSLASCVGYFVTRYCARHGIPSEGFTIETDWSMAEQPHRVGSVEMSLHLPTALTQAQQERLLKVAHGCTVHQSLAVPPNVAITLLTADQS
ncbi:MAG: OsmC family peroxiredoxin [Nitrospirae bacterium]|nr:MAG: OsmC family peroxiredoxin [Nitrospirota bacterium]